MVLRETKRTLTELILMGNYAIVPVKPGERIELHYTSRIDECNRRKAQAFISYSGFYPILEEVKEGEFPQQNKVCYLTLQEGCMVNLGYILSPDGKIPPKATILVCE